MKKAVFWDVAPCGLGKIDRCFRGTYCLHHHGPTRLHDITTQKIVIFILAAVRT
jgi:hypothetical protein